MKYIDSLRQLQTVISQRDFQQQQISVRELKIHIDRENLNQVNLVNLLSDVFPQCIELILTLNKTQLNDDFLEKFQVYLENKQNLIEKLYLQFHGNRFSINKVASLILLIRKKFYNDEQPIEYSYRNDNLVISSGHCFISFEYKPNSSIWVKELKENNISINIKQDQQNFMKVIQKQISFDIHDIQVELFYNNQSYANLSNGLKSCLIYLKLDFEIFEDLISFKFHDFKILEINFPFNDFQDGGFKQSQFYKQIKQRHNFSFIIRENITLFSFRQENISQLEGVYVKECLKQYDLNNSNKMNLNTNFKIQFYKDFVLQNQVESNSQSAYDINLYLIEDDNKNKITKIKYNLSQKIERKTFDIDLQSFDNVTEIIQSYFFILQNIDSQSIKLKLIALEKDQTENLFFDQINKINFFRAKIEKIFIDLNKIKSIQDYQFISQLNQIKQISLNLRDLHNLFEFLKKNRQNFKNQQNLINLDVQFQRVTFDYQFSDYQQHKQLFQEINNDYHKLISIQIYNNEIAPSNYQHMFQKLKRLTNLTCSHYKRRNKNRPSEDYDCMYYLNYIKSIRDFEKLLEQRGKAYFAYLLINNHDDLTCSYTRREACTCQNNLLQKMIKMPDNFFINQIVFNSEISFSNELQ